MEEYNPYESPPIEEEKYKEYEMSVHDLCIFFILVFLLGSFIGSLVTTLLLTS